MTIFLSLHMSVPIILDILKYYIQDR